ncbi:prephenate dehydratase [Pedobacter chitinilyticus]|uniref:prephenate dehydratase n=1 Tax=Pedobacter chitinilyticus TaxID=2233776 RepID=A0A3S3PQN8_9SPHI|nr:prephenate dehydratase [Pedobacter chitinilyticus]RWU10860.1 prephenate dehydratase [Pedobacter chitinilyticus]
MKTKTRVAIQGIKASFHEEAAYKFFGRDIETVECNSFKQTCDVLDENKADFVVMAIENSIAGSLLPNYTLIREYNFAVVGEVYLPIQLHLLALPGVKFEDIKIATSHPIAIRQCVDFFEEFPQIQVIEGNDTAACAKKIKDNQLKDTVAIANALAAETYGLDIIERRIESNKKNFTRFLILRKDKTEVEKGINKASICFQVGHHVGALSQVLQIFAELNVNLTKIQSMPVLGRRNEYYFYVDIEWKSIENYDTAIRKVLKFTVNFNIMGEYVKNDKV